MSMVYHELTDSGIWGVPSLEVRLLYRHFFGYTGVQGGSNKPLILNFTKKNNF